MKRAWKKLFWAMLCAAMMCTLFAITSQAAGVTTVCNYADKKTVFCKDVTGDGKADQVTISPVKNSYDCITGIRVYVNGNKVLSKKTSGMVYGVTVNYIQMSKSKVFLQIYTHSDNDYIAQNFIYRCNKKGTKLTQVLDLRMGMVTGKQVTSVTSNTIKVHFTVQPSEIGWVNWTYTYKYTGGKFKLKSSIASVKSSLTYDNGDGYSKLFRQNKFKAKKNLTFYTKTNLSTVSFTVKPGDIVKLKRIKVTDSAVYMQFQKGTKKGWQRVKQLDFDWFYGVSQRLAG